MVGFSDDDFVNVFLTFDVDGSEAFQVFRADGLLPSFGLVILNAQQGPRFEVANSRRTALGKLLAGYKLPIDQPGYG